MKSERKVAIITGASRGIGAALLKAYRDIGYHVVASSRSIDKSRDPSIPAVDGDIASAKTADRIVGLAIERYGRIDPSRRVRSRRPCMRRRRTASSQVCSRLGRMGEIQEVVDAVMYLERAAFVTGEIMHVDGGASAGRW
jgi:NAD(P)-dependent dehydrogenase (short-subunit alcohol dehydrogenase family)